MVRDLSTSCPAAGAQTMKRSAPNTTENAQKRPSLDHRAAAPEGDELPRPTYLRHLSVDQAKRIVKHDNEYRYDDTPVERVALLGRVTHARRLAARRAPCGAGEHGAVVLARLLAAAEQCPFCEDKEAALPRVEAAARRDGAVDALCRELHVDDGTASCRVEHACAYCALGDGGDGASLAGRLVRARAEPRTKFRGGLFFAAFELAVVDDEDDAGLWWLRRTGAS